MRKPHCLTFPGSHSANDSFITLGTLPNSIDGVTWEGWIRPTAYPQHVATPLIGTDDGLFRLQWGTNVNSSPEVAFSMTGTPSTDIFLSTTSLELNQWHHIAAVMGNIKTNSAHGALFLNGTLVDSATRSLPFMALTEAGTITFNRRNSLSKYKGDVAEIRLWECARTTTEILQNYNRYNVLPSSKSVTVFSETFPITTANSPAIGWSSYEGSGEMSIVAISGGGSALRVGDNSGNDQRWLVHDNSIRYRKRHLYKTTVRLRCVANSLQAYAGLAGVNSDGSTFENRFGADTFSNQHYHAIAGSRPSSAMTTYTGYTKGYAEEGDYGTNQFESRPGRIHKDAYFFKPLLLVNYQNGTGTTDTEYFTVTEIGDFLAAQFPFDDAIGDRAVSAHDNTVVGSIHGSSWTRSNGNPLFPQYTLGIEFESGSYTNVSDCCFKAYVDRGLGTWERQLPVGIGSFIMDNNNGAFSPANSASPYNGLLKPNKAVRLYATYAGSDNDIFNGWIKSFAANPIIGQRTVTLECVDQIHRLNSVDLNLPLLTDTNPASLFTEIMSQSNVVSFSADTLVDSISYAWFKDRNAQNALQQLAEAGHYILHNHTTNELHLHSRYYNLQSNVVNSYSEMFNLNYSYSDDTVLNYVKIIASPRKAMTSVSTIATISEDTVTIPGSSHVHFWLNYVDPDNNEENTPAVDPVTPVASTDYLFFTGTGETGTDRTATMSVNITFFGATAVCSIFNGAAENVYMSKFFLRGKPVKRAPTITGVTQVSSSQTTYGVNRHTIENDLIRSQRFAQDYSLFLANEYHDPKDVVSMAINATYPDVLQNELADQIHITEVNLGLASTFVIQTKTEEINFSYGLEHNVSYSLEPWNDLGWFILDESELDTGKLGF